MEIVAAQLLQALILLVLQGNVQAHVSGTLHCFLLSNVAKFCVAPCNVLTQGAQHHRI